MICTWKQSFDCKLVVGEHLFIQQVKMFFDGIWKRILIFNHKYSQTNKNWCCYFVRWHVSFRICPSNCADFLRNAHLHVPPPISHHWMVSHFHQRFLCTSKIRNSNLARLGEILLLYTICNCKKLKKVTSTLSSQLNSNKLVIHSVWCELLISLKIKEGLIFFLSWIQLLSKCREGLKINEWLEIVVRLSGGIF